MAKTSVRNTVNDIHHETQQRGSVLFPLQYNFCNTANPYYDLWLHYHSEYEIVHVTKGTYKMFICDREVLLEAGDSIIIAGNVIHGDAPDKGKGQYESVVFDLEMIRLHGFSPDEFLSEIISENVTLEHVLDSGKKECARAIENLFCVVREKEKGYDSIAAGYLLVIFGLLEKYHLYNEKNILPAKKRARKEKLDVILDFIKKHYKENVTLEEMASAVDFSPKYFCRLFRELTGRAPIEYLNWFRINKACALIRESNERLSVIANECGFKDFSYFIKIFHRYKGMTPLKYRNYDPVKNPKASIDYERFDD